MKPAEPAEQAVAQARQLNRNPTATGGDNQTVETAVRAVLERQQTAWNAGDVDAFMQGYWHSDELSFSAAGTTTRGWQATLDRYHQRYPSREAMGQLTFSNLEVTAISGDAALVLGNWALARDSGDEPLDDLGGNFSLVFRRLDDRWVIVHDHTSRAEGDAAEGDAP